MTQRKQKNLCVRLSRSIAWLTIIMVAFSCAIGYVLMARTLLAERHDYISMEIRNQAHQIHSQIAEQMDWLVERTAQIEEAIDGNSTEIIPPILQEWERINGNLTNFRIYFDEMIYQNNQFDDNKSRMNEEWIVLGRIGKTYLPIHYVENMAQITIAIPVQRERVANAVISADIQLENIFRNILHIKPIAGGYAALIDTNGKILSHPEIASMKELATSEFAGYPQSFQKMSYFKDYDGKRRFFVIEQIPELGWRLVYAIDMRSLLRPIEPILWILGALALLSGGIARLIIGLRLETLEEPLRQIGSAAHGMVRGHYKMKIAYEEEDEFGDVCRGIEAGLAWTARSVDDVAHALGRMGQGDFAIHSEEGCGDFLPIWNAVGKINNAMHSVFKQVNLSAKWALGGSHQVSGVVGRLSVGIESQSNSVEELNKAATLLRHESNQNALNASRAQEASLMVTSELRGSDRANAQLCSALREVEDAIRGLDAIIDHIQRNVTNGRMLSVSASAEAERIGEQALAFIVTVDELRELFLGSMRSAKEASESLCGAKAAVQRAQSCINYSAEATKRVMQKNIQTAEFVSRIASAAQLQAQAATKMSKEVSVISVVIQSNSQLAEQFNLSFGSLWDQAKVLSEMASVFHTKGDANVSEKSAPIIFDEDSDNFSIS